MADATPMRCPHCGHAMNHHSDKLVQPTTSVETASADPALGGIVHELHTCPACGTNASRRRDGQTVA